MSLIDSSVSHLLSRMVWGCRACKFVRVHSFSWTVICSCMLENARKTAAMHNSIKKTEFYKLTMTREKARPSVRKYGKTFQFHAWTGWKVKPGTHYKPTVRLIMNVIWAQAVFSVGVQSRLVWVCKEFKTSCCQASSQRLAYIFSLYKFWKKLTRRLTAPVS